ELLAAAPPAESPIFYLGMHVRELSSLVGAPRADPPDPALADVDGDLAARVRGAPPRGTQRSPTWTPISPRGWRPSTGNRWIASRKCRSAPLRSRAGSTWPSTPIKAACAPPTRAS